MWAAFRADVALARERRDRIWAFVFPSVFAVGMHRLAHALGMRGHSIPARALQILDMMLTGADLDWRARIGPGLFLEHPQGVCIGDGVVTGSNLVLGLGVLLGAAAGPNRTGGFPTIGDNVQIWAKASVIGPVLVGDGAIIGAHALVLHEVPSGAVARGVPARAYLNGELVEREDLEVLA